MENYFDIQAGKYTYKEALALVKNEDLYYGPLLDWVEDFVQYWDLTQNHPGGMSLDETAEFLYKTHPSADNAFDAVGFSAGVYLGKNTYLVI